MTQVGIDGSMMPDQLKRLRPPPECHQSKPLLSTALPHLWLKHWEQGACHGHSARNRGEESQEIREMPMVPNYSQATYQSQASLSWGEGSTWPVEFSEILPLCETGCFHYQMRWWLRVTGDHFFSRNDLRSIRNCSRLRRGKRRRRKRRCID